MTTTQTPCYRGNAIYHDEAIISIRQIETNRLISTLSLRTDATGVTFSDTKQPTLRIKLNHDLVSSIVSISVPNNNGVTNVNQIEVTFYDINGQILQNSVGEEWTVETIPGITTVCFIFLP